MMTWMSRKKVCPLDKKCCCEARKIEWDSIAKPCILGELRKRPTQIAGTTGTPR